MFASDKRAMVARVKVDASGVADVIVSKRVKAARTASGNHLSPPLLPPSSFSLCSPSVALLLDLDDSDNLDDLDHPMNSPFQSSDVVRFGSHRPPRGSDMFWPPPSWVGWSSTRTLAVSPVGGAMVASMWLRRCSSMDATWDATTAGQVTGPRTLGPVIDGLEASADGRARGHHAFDPPSLRPEPDFPIGTQTLVLKRKLHVVSPFLQLKETSKSGHKVRLVC